MGTRQLPFEVKDWRDAVRLIIKKGEYDQKALGEAIGIRGDSFSEKFNDPNNVFYRSIEDLITLMRITGWVTPLEEIAELFGYRLEKITDEQLNKAAGSDDVV